MAVYVVTWNLNKERSNYDAARRAFVEHLEKFEHVKDPGLESVRWIYAATWTASQVREYLCQKLDNNDRVFVSNVRKGERDGWLAQAVWEWINART